MVRGRSQLVAQNIVLPLQSGSIQAARHGIQKLIGAERLQYEVRGAGAQRLDGGLQVREGRYQNDLGEEPNGALLGKPLDAALTRHDVIQDQNIEVLLVELAGCLLGVGSRLQSLAAGSQR